VIFGCVQQYLSTLRFAPLSDWHIPSLFFSHGKIRSTSFRSNSMSIMVQTFFWDCLRVDKKEFS